MKPLLLLPPAVFAGFAALFFLGMHRADPDSLPSAFKGKPAPSVTAMQLGAAQPPTDAMLRDGRIKLVNFWASWCAPCRQEHPVLERLAQDGVEIVGIAHKDKPDHALGFLSELGNPYAILGADPDGRMGLNWGLYGVPETFVVAGDGTILARIAGPVTESTVSGTLAPFLK